MGTSTEKNKSGSPKGALENLQFIIEDLPHGIDILKGTASECTKQQ